MHPSKSGMTDCLLKWVAALSWVIALPVHTEETTCGIQHVTIVSSGHANSEGPHEEICRGAEDAIRFLGSQGLDVSHDIAIEVVQQMPHNLSESAIGITVASEHRTLILTYAKFRKLRHWFGVTADKSLYRSVVAHEVAHAIAAHNFRIAAPSIQAQEYIAYVTQFSTMAPAKRNKILSRYPNDESNDESKINATIYLFDPKRFGIKAYRHFTSLQDGPAFLQAILNGKALAE